MDLDDLEPRRPRAEPKNLDALGVAELEAYLGELEAEAARVKEKISAKKAYLTGADALFKR